MSDLTELPTIAEARDRFRAVLTEQAVDGKVDVETVVDALTLLVLSTAKTAEVTEQITDRLLETMTKIVEQM